MSTKIRLTLVEPATVIHRMPSADDINNVLEQEGHIEDRPAEEFVSALFTGDSLPQLVRADALKPRCGLMRREVKKGDRMDTKDFWFVAKVELITSGAS